MGKQQGKTEANQERHGSGGGTRVGKGETGNKFKTIRGPLRGK